jgi:hypothetical protein
VLTTDRLGNTITTQYEGDEVQAHAITVAFYSTDIMFPTASSPSSATASPKMTSPLSIPTSGDNHPDYISKSWPMGAAIGAGVGIGVGASLILLAIGWLVQSQYKKRANTAEDAAHPFAENAAHPFAKDAAHASLSKPTPLCEINGARGLYELGTNRETY